MTDLHYQLPWKDLSEDPRQQTQQGGTTDRRHLHETHGLRQQSLRHERNYDQPHRAASLAKGNKHLQMPGNAHKPNVERHTRRL